MKKQWMTRTNGAMKLAVYHKILKFIEDIAEEEGIEPSEITLSESILDSYLIEYSNELTLEYNSGSLQGTRREETIRLGDREIRIILEPSGELLGVTAGVVYERVPRIVLSEDSSLLKKIAFETTMNGIEYMGVYLNDGQVFFVEGELYRVSLPFVKSLATIHTHPEPACWLSLKDIESGLDLLVEGGLFASAVTQSCASIMYRTGFVIEDDYISLKEFILSKGKDVSKLSTLRSVRISRVAY